MTRPNILILMVDQLTGVLFEDGPAGFLKTPHLARLAERSLRFSTCYTASPLCTPARAAFMTGLLPSGNGVYDNAAELASSLPTYAHYLRRAGYQTCLSGKMHFIGADQLHGFEERLTTDIYPADFGWTPDYRKPGERIDWWYHNLGSVVGAGVAEITNQLEFDDEVAYQAERKLYDLARRRDERPWSLTVSFTHPHDPYVARPEYWELYADCPGEAWPLTPRVAPIPYEELDPHGQRIWKACDQGAFEVTPEHVARARRAYFASLSYLDAQIGRLLGVLERSGMAEDTAIVFLADHGDMLGERGLWYKMSFHEGSARIPLMIAAPGLTPGRIDAPVSQLDLLPTLAALGGVEPDSLLPVDGESLLPLAGGAGRTSPVLMEYAAEGSWAPLVSIRDGRWKFNACELDPPQLFDLENDPDELENLAGRPEQAERVAAFQARVAARWDLRAFDAAVRASQARRWVVYEALRQGRYTPWDFQPLQDASERFMRNHMDLNVVEDRQRVAASLRPSTSSG
ncbi:choline-sulfatase [Tistlia consotensis]|uniref:Choline-sulfatase n=1 Tax=Tistlia consotensis USBA 355 TaxID=560819 RepID=A0A1Y6BYI8_9PROT|nr:choline-sulfatase [Tistlia consotensis]SMF24542.1 choline-sulfatase [Tistlia consotensis USBA 355]SNR60382.1 choline-sulfatase [Tistlia consotensis]